MKIIKNHQKLWIYLTLIISVTYVLGATYILFIRPIIRNPFEHFDEIKISYENLNYPEKNKTILITNQKEIKELMKSLPLFFKNSWKQEMDCIAAPERYQIDFDNDTGIWFNHNCSTEKSLHGRFYKKRSRANVYLPKEFTDKIINILMKE